MEKIIHSRICTEVLTQIWVWCCNYNVFFFADWYSPNARDLRRLIRCYNVAVNRLNENKREQNFVCIEYDMKGTHALSNTMSTWRSHLWHNPWHESQNNATVTVKRAWIHEEEKTVPNELNSKKLQFLNRTKQHNLWHPANRTHT